MKTWKERRIDDHKYFYGDYVKKYEGHADDRQIYINTYNMILDALETLPDEPHDLIKVAMNKQLNKEYITLDSVIRRFR